jgi:hypothetical protein
MNMRVRMTLIALVLLSGMPGLARAGVCFDVTGLPEAAALDLVPLAAGPQGPIPLAGQAQGVSGLGQPPALVQGIAIVEPSGTARVAIKLLSVRAGCSGGEAELVLPPPLTTGSGGVRLPEGSVANVVLTLDPTGLACQPRSPRPTACVPNATTLCLLQNRFRVTATTPTQAGSAPGQALKSSSESGFFAFLEPSNVELVVKVLDGRGVNNFFWVLVTTTATDVEYTLTVTDTQTGRVKTYSNPVGAPAPPVFDTTALSPTS